MANLLPDVPASSLTPQGFTQGSTGSTSPIKPIVPAQPSTFNVTIPTTPPPPVTPTPASLTPDTNGGQSGIVSPQNPTGKIYAIQPNSSTPTPQQSGVGNPTGNGNYGSTASAPYGYSTVNGVITPNNAPAPQINSAPWGTNAQGVPYGSQYSNDANPDSTVYGQNGNPVNPNTIGNGLAGTGSSGNPNVDALNASYAKQAAAATTFANAVLSIQNGSTPLNAGEQAQIDRLKQQFDQLINTQGLVNTNNTNTAQIRGFQTGTAEFDRGFQAQTIGTIIQSGANKIANLQTQEASAVATLTQSLQNNDIAMLKTAYDAYDAAATATQNGLKAVIADTQQAMKDAAVQQVMSSGVTNPKDILAALQKAGYNDISSSDIASTISNLSPYAAQILSIGQTAASNGASADTISSIMSAPDAATALKIAAAGNVANSTVMDLLGKYPDAGIVPGDTIGQANAKILASPSYTQSQKSAALDLAIKSAQLKQTNAATALTEANIAALANNPNGQAIGTLGTSAIDVTAPGYATAPVAGGLTQSAIDQAALQFALTGVMPSMGLGSTGAAGERRVAIQNRAAEINAGGNIQANKATLTAQSAALKTQVAYLNTVQRSLSNAENGIQQLTTAFSGKINNDIPIANVLANAAAYQLGSADINAYKAALIEVGNEYTQVFSRGGQVSDQVRSTASELINGDISITALKAVSDELQTQGDIVIQGAQGQVQTIQNNINGIISGSGNSGPDLTNFVQGGTSAPGSTSNGVDLSKF